LANTLLHGLEQAGFSAEEVRASRNIYPKSVLKGDFNWGAKAHDDLSELPKGLHQPPGWQMHITNVCRASHSSGNAHPRPNTERGGLVINSRNPACARRPRADSFCGSKRWFFSIEDGKSTRFGSPIPLRRQINRSACMVLARKLTCELRKNDSSQTPHTEHLSI
jgi:hypothetical protein